MKVLILSITAGQGHNSTAKALKVYFEDIGVECQVLDTYYYINKILGNTVDKGYLLSVNAKSAYKSAYKHLENRTKNSYKFSATRFTNLALTHKLRKYLDRLNPDVIICTHVFAGIIIDVMKQLGELSAKTIGIITDFTVHPYWEEALRFDYMVLPNELLKIKAKKKGFSDSQILPFGIPIQPKFTVTIDKKAACEKIGIDFNKKTILLMGGSMGYGHLEKTVDILDNSDIDFQVITVCGNNKIAKNKIDTLIKVSHKTIVNYGFTDNIDELMSASDCIITKPGGLTTSESLAKRLPMIIVNPIPGQEDRNTEFLLNCGAAMYVTDTFPLDEILHLIFNNSERLRLMKESIETIRKPDSTQQICNFIKNMPI